MPVNVDFVRQEALTMTQRFEAMERPLITQDAIREAMFDTLTEEIGAVVADRIGCDGSHSLNTYLAEATPEDDAKGLARIQSRFRETARVIRRLNFPDNTKTAITMRQSGDRTFSVVWEVGDLSWSLAEAKNLSKGATRPFWAVPMTSLGSAVAFEYGTGLTMPIRDQETARNAVSAFGFSVYQKHLRTYDAEELTA